MDSDDSDVDEDVTQNDAFQNFLSEAKAENEDEWESKVDKYIGNRMDEDAEKSKADMKMMEQDKHLFFKRLHEFLLVVQHIRDSRLIKNILDEYDSLGNMTEARAMTNAIRKYKFDFDDLFDIDDESEKSDQEGSEDGESEEIIQGEGSIEEEETQREKKTQREKQAQGEKKA